VAHERGAGQNGYAIRAFRIKEGLTVNELANSIGVSYSHLQNIEHENRTARPEHLARIARVLHVPVAALTRVAEAEIERVPA